MRKILLPLLVVLALVAPGAAQNVFVNNKPFKGVVVGEASGLRLEAQTVVEMTSIGLQVADGKLMLDGAEVATTTEDGKLMVDAKALADQTGGRYVVNRDLGSVDVYLVSKPKESGGAASAPSAVGSLSMKHFKAKYPAGLFTPSGKEIAKARECEALLSRWVAAVAASNERAMASTLGEAMQSSSQIAKVIERLGGKSPVSVQLNWMGGEGNWSPVSAWLTYPGNHTVTCLLMHGRDRLIIYDIQF